MADAPWRCSQCGTINEPVANACRTCGRWPSLFELEGSTIELDEPLVAELDAPEAEMEEPEAFEPEAYDVDVELPEDDMDVESPSPGRRGRRIGSIIVPIAVVAYLVISALLNR